MPWYAHSLAGRPEVEWETQREHAERVAGAAALRADNFGMAPIAEAAGWLHDLGKYTPAFRGHIAGRGRAAEDRDHSSAGAVYARDRLGRPVGALVAHVVAGHHAGLKDALLGEDQRLDRREAALGPVVRTAGERDADLRRTGAAADPINRLRGTCATTLRPGRACRVACSR